MYLKLDMVNLTMLLVPLKMFLNVRSNDCGYNEHQFQTQEYMYICIPIRSFVPTHNSQVTKNRATALGRKL